MQDGYRVVEPEYFTDERSEPESPDSESLKAAVTAAVESVTNMRDKIV